MTKKKLFAITMALLLAVTIPLAVLAETYDLSKGSITVDAKEDGQYVSQDGGVQNEKQTTDTIIIQDKTESETTSNTITINAGEKTNDDGSKEKLTAEVTISGVDIDVREDGKAAVSTGGEGNVTIELDGDNTLKSGYMHAGLEKNNGGNLTIGDKDDNGSLAAAGGDCGAGIGGGMRGSGSNITIEGGNVKASGGWTGAGIGGGYQASGSDITIMDSNVTASGGECGAGIGGGYQGNGSNITITGSNVTASGGSEGAGIGGGGKGHGSNITITDSNVTASGGEWGAGIGGGDCGNGTNIAVSGDAQIKVSGGDRASDIGGGYYRSNGEIAPDTSALGENGSISYFAPGADKNTTPPERLLHKTDGGVETHDKISFKGSTATCTQAGTITYVCSCGEEIMQSSSPLGHDLEHHDGKEPTCTEDGYEEYDTCKREDCAYTTYQKIDALNHSFTNYVYQDDATCLEDGTEIAACDHAGCTETDKRTAKGTAKGHSFTNYVYQNDATCLEDGNEIATCDHTGCTETDERTAAGSATGHSFTDYVPNKDATYTQDGTETAECDHGCGETDTRTVEGSKLPLYRVTDENGKSVIHKANYSGSTLTITAELDGAILTGSTLALPVLQARGITTIVFVTGGTTSTFELADLLAKGEGTYVLTHAGENVTFTLESADIAEILKAE